MLTSLLNIFGYRTRKQRAIADLDRRITEWVKVSAYGQGMITSHKIWVHEELLDVRKHLVDILK